MTTSLTIRHAFHFCLFFCKKSWLYNVCHNKVVRLGKKERTTLTYCNVNNCCSFETLISQPSNFSTEHDEMSGYNVYYKSKDYNNYLVNEHEENGM